jgi:hypothetical protein
MMSKFTGILKNLGIVQVEGAEEQTDVTEEQTEKGKKTSATAKAPVADTDEPIADVKISKMSVVANPNEEQEMREKIHGLIVKMNREGYDFFELWDNVLEMEGGITPVNIRNAYKFLLKASAGQITPDVVEETCTFYTTKLQEMFGQDAAKKEKEKENLTQTMESEKTTLTQRVADLTQQIADLNIERSNAETELSQLSGKYTPQIQQINRKISLGKKYVDASVSEMETFLKTALPIIQNIQ